jgi:hypothetical protein
MNKHFLSGAWLFFLGTFQPLQASEEPELTSFNRSSDCTIAFGGFFTKHGLMHKQNGTVFHSKNDDYYGFCYVNPKTGAVYIVSHENSNAYKFLEYNNKYKQYKHLPTIREPVIRESDSSPADDHVQQFDRKDCSQGISGSHSRPDPSPAIDQHSVNPYCVGIPNAQGHFFSTTGTRQKTFYPY